MTTPTPETALARRWRLEINMATAEAPDWQLFPGITNFNWEAPPNLEETGEYEDGGWGRNVKTAQSWSVPVTFNRKHTADATAYSPVHEKVRLAAFGYGADSKIHLRFMDRTGLPEAYEGVAIPTWAPAGGEYTALDSVEATFAGDGPLTPITNPMAA